MSTTFRRESKGYTSYLGPIEGKTIVELVDGSTLGADGNTLYDIAQSIANGRAYTIRQDGGAEFLVNPRHILGAYYHPDTDRNAPTA